MGSSDRAANGGSYIYRASKAAATNLGRNLATDLAPRGIAVGIYHPGWVRTDMGGTGADISLEESVAGLMARFDALVAGHHRRLPHLGRAPHPVLTPAPSSFRKTPGGGRRPGGGAPTRPARPTAPCAPPAVP
jgi:NAD(P)-dependent dehydrogenase (short-subunit alcohol dehydrogenase family)